MTSFFKRYQVVVICIKFKHRINIGNAINELDAIIKAWNFLREKGEVPLRVENCYKLKSPLEINIDEELKMKHACSKLVLGNVYVHRCKLAGKYFENEKWWCGIHRPSRVEKHKEKIKKIVRIELDKLDQLDKKDKATEALIRAVEEAHDWFDAAGYHDEVLLNDIFKAYLKLLNLRRKAISTTGAEGKDDV